MLIKMEARVADMSGIFRQVLALWWIDHNEINEIGTALACLSLLPEGYPLFWVDNNRSFNFLPGS